MLIFPPFLIKVLFPPSMVFNKYSKLYANENTWSDSAFMGTQRNGS
jgi:hypothetical protein